ncbi:MAG: MFS transporter, partial [Aggregatilineales bacterium]
MLVGLPRKKLFWAVGSAHLVNDIFMSFGAVLLAFLSISVLPMTNTQIGIAISLRQLLSAISQPGFGIRADRYGGRGVGAGGLLWVVFTFMLSIIAAIATGSYILMLIPFVLQGLGSGAVHPVGSLHATESDKDRAGSSIAYFFLMGQLGLAIGPTLIGLLLDAANPDPMAIFTAASGLPPMASFRADFTPIFFAVTFAILPVWLMLTTIPLRKPVIKEKDTSEKTASTGISREVMIPFLILGVMVILRSLANPGAVSFIPVLFQQKGWSPSEYGFITS